MRNKANQRIEDVTQTTLVVGVDIAKTTHWARFTNYRGIELGKAIKFNVSRAGFESIVARLNHRRLKAAGSVGG